MYHTQKSTNQNNVTRCFRGNQIPYYKAYGVFKTITTTCTTAAFSPINTWRILMKLRLAIPVLHANLVWQLIEHRSKVKIIKNIKTIFLVIIFESEVVDFWLVAKFILYKHPWHTTNRYVTSNKTNECCIFSKFFNIGAHFDRTYTTCTMHLAKKMHW